MKNAGMAGAVALVGIGLITIGLSNFANQAEAVPSAAVAITSHSIGRGGEQPRIVAMTLIRSNSVSPIYGTQRSASSNPGLLRVWSNGVIEAITHELPETGSSDSCGPGYCGWTGGSSDCLPDWTPLEASLDGLTCTEDLNGDRVIDGKDLGILIANWGPTSAALLANPEIGVGEVVDAVLACYHSRTGNPLGTEIWVIYRQWDTGVTDWCVPTLQQKPSCLFPPLVDFDGCCEFGASLGPHTEFQALPTTMPMHRQLGDLDRSGTVDGGDLGPVLGAWPACPQ